MISPVNVQSGKQPSNASVSTGKTKSCHQCKRVKPSGSVLVWCKGLTDLKKKCSFVYCDKCLLKRYREEAEKITTLDTWICPRCRGVCDCSDCKKRKGGKPIGHATAELQAMETAEIIPEDVVESFKELTSVVGIDMAGEHVGKALQFLEFCACFGEILDIKKGEPQCVLHDMMDDKAKGRGKSSVAVKFHIHLLRIIQEERGEKHGRSSNRKSKIQWFDTLKRFLSGSQSVLRASGFDSLDDKADYDALNSSDKLMLLNTLCDEVLGTKHKRNSCWSGVDKETSLKRTRGDADNAVISGSDTLRTEPFYRQKGCVFWKLKALAESDILLCQNIGKDDVLTLDAKWSSVNAASKEAIEKHILSLQAYEDSRERKKPRRGASLKEIVSGKSEETERAL